MSHDSMPLSAFVASARSPKPQPPLDLRSFSFFCPDDLNIYSTGGAGDDGRTSLPLSEPLVVSLLITRAPVELRTVFGKGRPLLCTCNSSQPISVVTWDCGEGKRVWITDGRQRAGDSAQRGEHNPGAIEEINRRVRQLCDLAVELANKDTTFLARLQTAKNAADFKAAVEMLRIMARNEAINRQKSLSEWKWARQMLLPFILGGKIGEGDSELNADSLIDWRPFALGGPVPIPYVAAVWFEPVDRDPGTYRTQLGSLGLKSAQVATPPTVRARQIRDLTAPRKPPKLSEETEAEYSARLDAGGPWGHGFPINQVAAMMGLDKNTVQADLRILSLEPEVQAALDAQAEGEEGLSMNQVLKGGFFTAGSGGAGNERLPKPREEQLRLLSELRGKRGYGPVSTSGSSSGSDSSEAPRREVHVTDSALARHRADEPRAAVGPDSPSTANEAPKAARLEPAVFIVLREKIQSLVEMHTARDGILPNGDTENADSFMIRAGLDLVYHVLSFFAGDSAALTGAASPNTANLHQMVKDAFLEVMRARGLNIRHGVGPINTGVPVLPPENREPGEMIVTPREPSIAVGEPSPSAPESTPAKAKGVKAKSAKKPTKTTKTKNTKKPAKAAKAKTTTGAKKAK